MLWRYVTRKILRYLSIMSLSANFILRSKSKKRNNNRRFWLRRFYFKAFNKTTKTSFELRKDLSY